jgi:peptidoglycan/xylan/chitin deacetylase (PgdA/CDA1 family)
MGWSLRAGLCLMLDAAGLVDLRFAARTIKPARHLPILTYHRIGIAPRLACDLDETVVDATPKGFQRQLELLTRRFTLIGIADLRRHFVEDHPLPANPALLTFDDGYREAYDVALPALQRAGAKAVFFIPTDYVTERRAFWWDRVSYLIKRSTRTRAEVEYPHRLAIDLAGRRAEASAQILDVIKNTYALDVEAFLQGVGTALGVPWHEDDDRRIAGETIMTWQEVQALHRAGMDVQSHTRTHRALHTLPPDHIDDELAGSRRILEQQLGAPVDAIAYPVTSPTSAHDGLFAAVQRAGYTLGFSTSQGLTPHSADTSQFNIPRMWMDSAMLHSYLRAVLAFPRLAYRRR